MKKFFLSANTGGNQMLLRLMLERKKRCKMRDEYWQMQFLEFLQDKVFESYLSFFTQNHRMNDYYVSQGPTCEEFSIQPFAHFG